MWMCQPRWADAGSIRRTGGVMSESEQTDLASDDAAPANDGAKPATRWGARLEVVEIVLLALVTVLTAWSGFQGTKWGGRQSTLYGQASTTRFAADAASTLGAQQLAFDGSLFTAWLQAESAGDTALQAQLVRRFTPEYRAAFEAWLKTDPLTDPSAPAGPGYMPGFQQPNLEHAERLNDEASALFAQGTDARETANKYVRDTVLFASVLFLLGASQRFRTRRLRLASTVLAFALFGYTILTLVGLPRA